VLAEFVPKRHFDWKTRREGRRMNLFRRRTIPENSMMHWSVFEREGNYAARLPKDTTTFPKPVHAVAAQPHARSVRTRPICAARYWNDTGVRLKKGASYRLTVVPGSGEPLRDAGFIARGIEGEQWHSVPHDAAVLMHGKRLDSAKWFALVGTVEMRDPWAITDRQVVTAPADGRLMCYFNDVQFEIFYRNNSGWVVLDVEQV
jgi:hypothetical protein